MRPHDGGPARRRVATGAAILVILFAGQTLLAQDATRPYPDPPRIAQTPQIDSRSMPPTTGPTTGPGLVPPIGEALQPVPPSGLQPPALESPTAPPGPGSLSSAFQPAFSPEQSGALGGQPFAIAATGGYFFPVWYSGWYVWKRTHVKRVSR